MNRDMLSGGLAAIAAALDPRTIDPWTVEQHAEFREMWDHAYDDVPEDIRDEVIAEHMDRMQKAIDTVQQSRAAIVGSTLIHGHAGMVARHYPGVDLEEI
jgi:hypothetical protein